MNDEFTDWQLCTCTTCAECMYVWGFVHLKTHLITSLDEDMQIYWSDVDEVEHFHEVTEPCTACLTATYKFRPIHHNRMILIRPTNSTSHPDRQTESKCQCVQNMSEWIVSLATINQFSLTSIPFLSITRNYRIESSLHGWRFPCCRVLHVRIKWHF